MRKKRRQSPASRLQWVCFWVSSALFVVKVWCSKGACRMHVTSWFEPFPIEFLELRNDQPIQWTFTADRIMESRNSLDTLAVPFFFSSDEMALWSDGFSSDIKREIVDEDTYCYFCVRNTWYRYPAAPGRFILNFTLYVGYCCFCVLVRFSIVWNSLMRAGGGPLYIDNRVW